jgi:hypothetical protein
MLEIKNHYNIKYTHLYYQHLAGWSRRITKFKTSLSYIAKTCILKKKKKTSKGKKQIE